MRMERVKTIQGKLTWFSASDGMRLQGFLVEPRKKTKRAMLFVHGGGQDFLWESLIGNLSKRIADAGLAFLTINTRGANIIRKNYSDASSKNKVSYLAGYAYERIEESLNDLVGAVRALRELGYTDIVLVGHCLGCQKVLYFMRNSKLSSHVSKVVLLSPVDLYSFRKTEFGERFDKILKESKKLVERGMGDTIIKHRSTPSSAGRFLEQVIGEESRVLSFNTHQMPYLQGITVPTLVIMGEMEELLPKPIDFYISKFKKNLGNNLSLVVIGGVGHSLEPKMPEIASKICIFASEPVR